MEVDIPYNYSPRQYQMPILKAIDSGKKRLVWVSHRRSGKDKTCLNIIAKKMLERVGSYYYFFPEFAQGRKVIWEGMDKDGFRFIDHFHPSLLDGKPNDTEMKLTYKNGSQFRIIGTDNFNSIMGTNPVGCVFSEYSLQDPQAWGYLRPILAENGGWAIFNFTPRGENHGYDIYKMAKSDPEWFCELVTVDDTKAIDAKILESERNEIIQLYGNDSLYQQEYLCSFSVPQVGAYYGDQISLLYKNGRVTKVKHEDSIMVDTWWDLGVNDIMAIWFTQQSGNEVRVIDYLQGSGFGLDHYIKLLQEKPYIYKSHNAPHDIKVRELTTGRTRLELASTLGINFNVVSNIPVIDGINSARSLLRRCWFDEDKCKDGLNALKSYRKQYDEKRKTYLDNPYHDWSSNAADAFRMMAVGMNYELVPVNGSFELQKKSAENRGWVHPRFRRVA